MESLSAAFVGKLEGSITMKASLLFCISNNRLLSMQGTDFQDVSLKNKLSIKNPFLPLGGQEKQKVHYFRPHRHLERDGLGVHRVLKVPEAGLCAEILSPAGETQVIFLGIGHWI